MLQSGDERLIGFKNSQDRESRSTAGTDRYAETFANRLPCVRHHATPVERRFVEVNNIHIWQGLKLSNLLFRQIDGFGRWFSAQHSSDTLPHQVEGIGNPSQRCAADIFASLRFRQSQHPARIPRVLANQLLNDLPFLLAEDGRPAWTWLIIETIAAADIPPLNPAPSRSDANLKGTSKFGGRIAVIAKKDSVSSAAHSKNWVAMPSLFQKGLILGRQRFHKKSRFSRHGRGSDNASVPP